MSIENNTTRKRRGMKKLSTSIWPGPKSKRNSEIKWQRSGKQALHTRNHPKLQASEAEAETEDVADDFGIWVHVIISVEVTK